MEARNELETGSTREIETTREIVFISHANPEDNDFTIWLGARLTELGYEVWSDVIRLKGGEAFWSDIGDVIRKKAAKVIVCLSKKAVIKEGVKNEIALAMGVCKKLGQEFLIPAVIDGDFSYDDDLPPQIVQKNCIPFAGNWAAGFRTLENILSEQKVPKPNKDLQYMVELWKHAQAGDQSRIIGEPETLISNWYPLVLPEELDFYSIERPIILNEVKTLTRDLITPAFGLERLIGGFGSVEQYQHELGDQTPIQHQHSVNTIDFLWGRPESGPAILASEAKKLMNNLISKAWDLKLAERGFIDYEMANGHRAWFLPTGFVEGDKVIALRPDSTTSKRLLVGRVNPKDVYWHFAISARPSLYDPVRLQLQPHVLFTKDGKNPIPDKKKMQSLRKACCKLWFNSKWRDLILAYMTFLSEGNETINLPAGDGKPIQVAAMPLQFVSPVSVPRDDEPVALNDESEIIAELQRQVDADISVEYLDADELLPPEKTP